MLTLTRKVGESIRIGDDIVVIVKEIKGKQVRIGIEAPRDVYVCREELFLKIKQANLGALAAEPPVASQDDSNSPDVLTALSQAFLSRQSGKEASREIGSDRGSPRETSDAGVTSESASERTPESAVTSLKDSSRSTPSSDQSSGSVS